ncbi:MAG: hypothetical protein A4E32_00050 [Methanomassiliicoccales archaeon PtaU1.Bin124]|nr:MAG: hypothetical protein A4E32_00050 [Methanomassiliicoccales archaeon PtaU1.Bin124]
MRIAIVACDAIREEIESVVAGDEEIVSKEYLDFGLHLEPETMKQELKKKVESLKGKADVVFLGYAHCQALKGLPLELSLPTVMLEDEDCIASLLGTEEYHRQKKNGGITWFYPSGWATYGMDGLNKLFHMDCVADQGYKEDEVLKMIFEGFSRCLFIDTGKGDVAHARKCSCNFAKVLDLHHEETTGSLDIIKERWELVKNMNQ